MYLSCRDFIWFSSLSFNFKGQGCLEKRSFSNHACWKINTWNSFPGSSAPHETFTEPPLAQKDLKNDWLFWNVLSSLLFTVLMPIPRIHGPHTTRDCVRRVYDSLSRSLSQLVTIQQRNMIPYSPCFSLYLNINNVAASVAPQCSLKEQSVQ